MSRIEEVRLRNKRLCAEHLFAHRSKALSGLLSRRASLFLFFNLLYGVIFSAPLAHLCRFALEQQYYPHFGLILLISFYLMHTRRRALFASAEYCAWGGIPLVVIGVLGYLLGLHQQQHLSQNDFFALTTLGMVTVWVGGFVTFFGLLSTWAARFPLGFLIFTIPLPEALLSHSITMLQYASAEVTYVLFKLAPLPVFREGFYFELPGLYIEVTKECSGIRSSMALLIASILISHLCLRYWWSKSVVWLLVYPLAVFKNGVRIVTLCLLTLYVDKGFIQGSLHTRGGAVFFGLALAMLLPILLGLRKLEAKRVGTSQ